MTMHTKSHADFLKFDRTEDGRRKMLEAITDDVIAFWQPLEPLRNPQEATRQRIDVAVLHNTFCGSFVDTNAAGHPMVSAEVTDFGPLFLLLTQAAQLLQQRNLALVWTALDKVRELRDQRRGDGVTTELAVKPVTVAPERLDVADADTEAETERPRRPAIRRR
jgi:hypothetical protein